MTASSARFAEVVFPVPLNQRFTYRIPKKYAELLVPGMRVLAPFGRKRMTGYVTAVQTESAFPDLRDITAVLDPIPVFAPELMALAQWMAEYYMTSLGIVLHTMLPPGIEIKSEKFVLLKAPVGEFEVQAIRRARPVQAKILNALIVHKKMSLKALQKNVASNTLQKNLKELVNLGLIEIREEDEEAGVSVRYEKWVHLEAAYLDDPGRLVAAIEDLERRSPKQAAILSHILERLTQDAGEETFIMKQNELLAETRSTLPTLQSLAEKGIITIREHEVFRDPYYGEPASPKRIRLNDDQVQAVAAITEALQSQSYHTFLLYGVTGSGKTQVYIESVKEVLAGGRTAIILVPEIALTPQAVERFRSYFGSAIAVWHSRMSAGERFDAWRKILAGEFRVVIGARSAIFTPLKNLGLIVVDEEHENTYKQSEPAPRYHARDVAVMRALRNEAVVVLGSATPSIESYHNALTGKYTLLELPRRIRDVPMPEVTVVDMRAEKEVHMDDWQPIFSRALRERIQTALRYNQQIILFQNRRGYATFVECYDCGFVAECPHCSISLTYHQYNQKLKCHYCGYSEAAYQQCPQCANLNILNYGIGTQRVEELLKDMYRGVSVARMDLDTTTAKGSHYRILERFKNNDVQILLGTQMITKGLDFENVTVVGVISADTTLLLPDFRSGERTFQLLTQVAGRAGRQKKTGHVVVQTLNPDRAAIQFAKNHDFRGFYAEEIRHRQELNYPPFGRLIVILFKSKEEKKVIEQCKHFCDILKDGLNRNHWATQHAMVLGPTAAPIARIKNFYRWHILVKVSKQFDKSGSLFRHILLQAKEQHHRQFKDPGVNINIEVDPHNVL